MKDVLVTGGKGQLGIELQRATWPANWRVVAIDIDELDLTDRSAVAAKITERPWAAVISAGAYTAVDRAEDDVIAAWEVNAMAPATLAVSCAKGGIPIVQVSTDYVFAGNKMGAWEPCDAVGPLGVYGASKLGGELAVSTSGARHVIVRTAWVVSAHGNNFVKTMLRIGADRPVVSVVDDQFGSPTSAADLAEALATIVVRLVEDAKAPEGIYHFSNADRVSWHGFATEIFAQASARGRPSPIVSAILSNAYPTRARRPMNSLLSHAAIARDYGIEPRSWRQALGEILDELIGKAV